LANSLKIAKNKAVRGILRTKSISRLHLTRLITNGWLSPILRGWYLLKQPISQEGESTSWYSSLFASGGFPWTIISIKNRTTYFKALGKASVEGDIKSFAQYLLSEMIIN